MKVMGAAPGGGVGRGTAGEDPEVGRRAGESGKRQGAADRGEGGSGGPREERKSRGLMLRRENPACSELTVSPWSE